jgi:hypothetical protein
MKHPLNVNTVFVAFSLAILACAVSYTPQLAADDFSELSAAERLQSRRDMERVSPETTLTWKAIITKAEELDRMPSFPEFMEILVEAEGPFTENDQMALFSAFHSVQLPPVTRSELVELLRAQRDSISSYRVNYVTNYRAQTNTPRVLEMPMRLECDFAFDERKLFIQQATFHNDELKKTETEGFDGEILRGLLEGHDHSPHGSVRTIVFRECYYKSENPFLAAGLLNGPADWGRKVTAMAHDLAHEAEHSFFYETPVEIDGVECIVFGTSLNMIFCSPEHSYALMEVRSSEFAFDKESGRYVRDGSFVIQKNSDFIEVADELWLPKTIEHLFERDGEAVVDYTTTVESYEVNEDIPEDLFTDIIPEGVLVTDVVLDLIYRQGPQDDK